MKYLFRLFILSIVLTIVTLSQETEKMGRLRMAQGFEEAGEWERAVELYESLYNSEPRNYIFVDGLQRSYTQIKEYEKAIFVIRKWLTYQPRDINMKTKLGGLYYDSGNEIVADSIWKSIIASDPANIQLYRIVASEMLDHRLFDKSINIYIEGRRVGKKENLFADELGVIYSALQQYKSAAKEYALLVKFSPEQLPLAQSRLSSITQRPEALKSAIEVVSIDISSAPENIALKRLYVWLLIEGRNYSSALDQYRLIDRLSKANCNELFSFAQRLDREREFLTSAKTYKEIIGLNTNQQIIPFARFNYARSIEELSALTETFYDTASIGITPTFDNAIKLYESITLEIKIPDLISQSFYRIGVIKFEKLFDLDGALVAFNRVKNISQAPNLLPEAILKSGEVQLARNNLKEAEKEFDRLGKMPQVVHQDLATFKIAELNYFESRFDSALSLLKKFNAKLNTELANDALQLQYFIQENQSASSKALTEFAKSDLLQRQRKYSESLTLFKDIVKNYSSALLVDDAMMKIGELQIKLLQVNEAIKSFQFIVDSVQMSILKDRAQFRIAEVYQTIIKNKTQAIESYEKLLVKFPNSLYAEESRKRIRLLRGDNL